MRPALSWAGTLAALAAMASGCAEYMPYSPGRSYGYGNARPAPVYVASPAPVQRHATVAQSSLPPVDRSSTGAGYGRQRAEAARWTAGERERRIREYLARNPETGYGVSRDEIQARLRDARRRLDDYRESQSVLGYRDFSRDYERRLQEGVAREERELERIDALIVDAMLADEAAAAARHGAPTAAERERLGVSGRNAGRAAGESRRRAEDAFGNSGW